jgi:hypothetical protein
VSIKAELSEAEQAMLVDMEAELFKPSSEEAPPVLFHYTTPQAFHSIVAGREIWATHFRYLNDPKELLHGEEIVFEEAKALLDAAEANTLPWAFLQRFVEDFPKNRLSEAMNVYVASLSEEGDQLSQWRAYGGDGAGYSIGFNSLPRPAGNEEDAPLGMTLFRCNYDAALFQSQARDMLKEVAAGFDKYVEQRAEREEAARAFFGTALSICFRRIAAEVLRLKHGAYAEEKEWRLIVLAAPPRENAHVKIRSSTRGLIPYIPVGLLSKDETLLGIDRVFVGPGEDQARATLAAKMLLSSAGYAEDLVSTSQAPYRQTK